MFYFCLGMMMVLSLLTLRAVDAGTVAAENPVVVMDTTLGPITIELDQAKAPITVANFLKYVDSGFYENLIFHRVISDFMIQGGGLDDQMREKEKGANPPIKNEASNGLSNRRGTIAMARTNDPDSATSQFFINLFDKNTRALDARPGSAGYAVFGKVTEGMETVDAIAKVGTTTKGPHENVPTKPVYIKSVKRKAKS
ncbi:MAG: peptidylprolyl isomerase A [Isosphaeraceae bacterium]